MIYLLDYGVGNLASLSNTLEFIGCKSQIIQNPVPLKITDKLILPGVGAFNYAIDRLNRNEFGNFIQSAFQQNIKILGICLGMQLFYESSMENGYHNGLGFMPGNLTSFKSQDSNLRIPRIGWGEVFFHKSHPVLEGIKQNSYFYFLHSFFCPIN